MTGPQSALTADLIEYAREHKTELMAALANPAPVEERVSDDLAERVEERAAILEFDAGFSRADVERLAREMECPGDWERLPEPGEAHPA